jgi:Raf kinase inhibitor-like YbhB/YbcL family protein
MKHQTLCTVIALIATISFLGAKKMPIKNHTINLSSSSFTHQSRLPIDLTCEGKDISPQLSWNNIPSGVKSFALICDDPDAPAKIWVHWIMFNIPATVTTLAAGVATTPTLANGAGQGINDAGGIGYGGACPPKGHGVHHYIFTLYALDTILDLKQGVSRTVLENAMKDHILATGQLIGTYSRK